MQKCPWYFFLPTSDALLYLSQAWSTASNIDEITFHFFSDGGLGGQTEETQRVELEQAQVWGIERVVVPDPSAPDETLDFVRVQVGYADMTWTLPVEAQETQLSGPTTSVPFETPACSASEDPQYRYFLYVDNQQSGVIDGDATFPGEEGSIEVFGVCHSSFRAVSLGSSSGIPRMNTTSILRRWGFESERPVRKDGTPLPSVRRSS